MTPYESIIRQLAISTGLTRRDVRSILRRFYVMLAAELRQHPEVKIRNLGRFRRSGYNLEMDNLPDGSEEELWFQAVRISFRASPKFRYLVLGHDGGERAMQALRW